MRKTIFLFSIIIAVGLGVAFFQPNGIFRLNDVPASSDRDALIMHALLGGLEQMHFNPQAIDDNLSAQAFDLFIDRLDGNKRFLIQSEVDQLRAYRLLMDDQAEDGEFALFDMSEKLMETAFERTQTYYQEILANPFSFDKTEKVEMDVEKRNFVNTTEELRERWRQSLKYEALSRVYSRMEKQKKAVKKAAEEEEEYEEKSFEEIEADVREDILEDYERSYKRMDKLRRNDRMVNYINSITNVFDPHTGYFQPKEKEAFDIGLSGTLEGIGARLNEKDDYIRVVEVIPGGPAWKGKELEANDLITAVAQGDDEPVNVVGWRVDDAVSLIRGKKGTVVNLTVQKADGSTAVISITRDVVIIDENYAKSAMLELPEVSGKIGYLKLPSFYADFSRKNGRSSANDVAIELKKLKAEGAEGIILDLRFNTGGSLRDAVKMSGLFIDEGPVVQVKDRIRPTRIYRDTDERIQYSGPLVVLVNNFSASASEILAAALQDYGRAVIVGSQSTYGKGTVQQFINLDRAISGYEEYKPLGQVKMTIQKFYRIDGGSTQLRGVEPDIVLPDKYMFVTTGERENDHPLAWTSIDPAEYDTKENALAKSYLPSLVKQSQKRVSKNDVFEKVEANAHRLKKNDDLSVIPLNKELYNKLRQQQKEEAEQFKNIFQPIENLNVSSLAADKEYLSVDESRQVRFDDWVKSIEKDVYIEEAMYILENMFDMGAKVAKGK